MKSLHKKNKKVFCLACVTIFLDILLILAFPFYFGLFVLFLPLILISIILEVLALKKQKVGLAIAGFIISVFALLALIYIILLVENYGRMYGVRE